MAYIRPSTPDSGLGSQVKAHKIFSVVPSSLGSGMERRTVGAERGREAPPERGGLVDVRYGDTELGRTLPLSLGPRLAYCRAAPSPSRLA